MCKNTTGYFLFNVDMSDFISYLRNTWLLYIYTFWYNMIQRMASYDLEIKMYSW